MSDPAMGLIIKLLEDVLDRLDRVEAVAARAAMEALASKAQAEVNYDLIGDLYVDLTDGLQEVTDSFPTQPVVIETEKAKKSLWEM